MPSSSGVAFRRDVTQPPRPNGNGSAGRLSQTQHSSANQENSWQGDPYATVGPQAYQAITANSHVDHDSVLAESQAICLSLRRTRSFRTGHAWTSETAINARHALGVSCLLVSEDGWARQCSCRDVTMGRPRALGMSDHTDARI
jgi:hypothetical protein